MATWSKLYPGGGGHMITGGAAAAVFLNMKMKNLFSKERFNNNSILNCIANFSSLNIQYIVWFLKLEIWNFTTAETTLLRLSKK